MAGYAQVTHEIFMHFQECFNGIGRIRSGLAGYALGGRMRSSVFGHAKNEMEERMRRPDTLTLEPDTLN